MSTGTFLDGERAGVAARPRAQLGAALWLPTAVGFAVGALLFPSSGRDDSYLTYWPAHALATTGEIVNLNGERVEQSSSLLEVVLLAGAAAAVPIPLAILGLALSVLAGLGCVALAHRIAPRLGADPRSASWLVATATPLVYWSFSGLETSLAALLGLALVAACADHLAHRDRRLPAPVAWAVMGLFLAVRPETVFVLALALAGALVVALVGRARSGGGPFAPSAVLGLALAAGLCFLPLVLFRLAWFGAPFPQPVAAKSFTRIASDGLDALLAAGADYLVAQAGTIFLAAFWLGICAAGVTLWRALRGVAPPPHPVFAALFCGAYLAFVLTTGGDYMEGARYVVPCLPVALLQACGLLRREVPRVAGPALAGLVALQLAGSLSFARSDSTGVPLASWLAEDFAYESERFAWTESANRVHRRDLGMAGQLPAIVARIHAHTERPVTVMSRQMGMVPYYVAREAFGSVRFIDAYGLATRDITSPVFASLLPDWRRERFATLFENPEAVERAWGLARPDVLYDLRAPPSTLSEHGYTIVFQQSGHVTGPSRLFRGGPVLADCWIAVRDDLLPLLAHDVSGRWRQLRPERGNPGLTPEQRDLVARLEAIGYVSGSGSCGPGRSGRTTISRSARRARSTC